MEQSSITEACQVIAQRSNRFQPLVGLILGSGLGLLAERIENAHRIPYGEIPGFPESRVPGHAGNFVLGYLSKVPVVAMQGRAHLYEGWTASKATFPLQHRISVHF